MFVDPGLERPPSLSYVAPVTGGAIGPGTGSDVDDACLLGWLQFVFWLDEAFAHGAT